MGIKKLSHLTPEALKKQRAKLCSLCGHFKDFDLEKPNHAKDWITDEQISSSWQRAYQKWHTGKPELTLY